MGTFTSCCNRLAALSRGAAKAAGARLREMGLLKEMPHWSVRARICERCPLRVIRKNISYCGVPLMEKTLRDSIREGCGCPIHAKAKDPTEHCPLNLRHQPATRTYERCDCKWCAESPRK